MVCWNFRVLKDHLEKNNLLMMKEKNGSQPINPKHVIRVLSIIFILTLLAGYYMTRLQELQKI
jgi:hypothetical protein